MFVEMIKIKGVRFVVWVRGYGYRSEDGSDAGREIDGCGECGDGGGFGDVFAGVREDVVVCESVDHGAW